MPLSPKAIPQLIIQEVDIRDGIENNITQTINQNITVYVLKSPSIPDIKGVQGFIQTDTGDNNEVTQDITQTMGNFPLFSNYYSLASSDPIDTRNISLDFQEFINNDDILRTLQFENQRVFIEGDEDDVDLFSEQIIYDLSWYEKLISDPDYYLDKNIDLDSFLKDFVGDFLVDGIQVAVQDLVVDGNNNDIVQSINQTFSTFIFLDDSFTFEPSDLSNLDPIQFLFQESFADTENNSINQTVNQNINFNFTFADPNLNSSLTQSDGVEITDPQFDIDNFIFPILDNTVPDSDLFENHQVSANTRSSQITDILGNQNTDTKSSSQIILLTPEGTAVLDDPDDDIFDDSLSNLFSELQTLVLTGNENEVTQDNLGDLFEQILDSQPSQILVSNPIVNEAENVVEFTIERFGDLSRYVKIQYITEDGLAKAGFDYLPIVGQVIFTPNEVTKTVQVPLHNSSENSGEFNLLTKVIRESNEVVTGEFSLYGDSGNGEIPVWSYDKSLTGDSLTDGYLGFDVTTTDNIIDVQLFLDGVKNVNSYFIFNPEINQYQEFIYDGLTGARFFTDNLNDQVEGTILRLENGGNGDLDSSENIIANKGFFARTTPGLFSNNGQTFFIPTPSDGWLQSRLINAPNNSYEVGLIAVDDVDGKIGSLNPTDLGYEEAAMARKTILFENQDSAATQALTQEVARQSFTNPTALAEGETTFFGDLQNSTLPGDGYYMLYLENDGEISFPVDAPLNILSEGRGYHQISFNDLTLEVSTNTLVTPSSFNQPVTVNISRAGTYNNMLALFSVDTFEGGIDTNGDSLIDVRPGDGDYARIALERAKDPLKGTTLTMPDTFLSTTTQEITLEENSIYGFALIPNATVDDVLNNNPSNDLFSDFVALFSFGTANPDGINHTTRLGSNLFGFEDILGGGDLDYNDVILEFNFS